MKIKGPIITLIVGVVIAAAILILSIHAKAAPKYGLPHVTSTIVGGVA